MKKENIIVLQAVVHVLDSSVGMPVLSDCPVDLTSNQCDFIKAHIEKFTESDEVKVCHFTDGSAVGDLVKGCNAENFIQISQKICTSLYGIMNANIDIPAGDAVVVAIREDGIDYFGLLKLDYKSSYTHYTHETGDGNANEIILQKAILPSVSQKLSEAFLVNLATGEIFLTEKKCEVNGEKMFYFSELFLDCNAPLSQKSKLDIMTRVVEQINKKYAGDEDILREMEIKQAFYDELEKNGCLCVENVKERVFGDNPEMQVELDEKLEKYNMSNEVVKPKNETTIRKFQTQRLVTDTGIELVIPMEDYKNPDKVEFVTQPDGTISVLLKNIGKLQKMRGFYGKK